jgi:hypothetical protein
MINKALETDPSVTSKSIKEQFEKLILQPLYKIPAQKQTRRFIVVINALDKCERERDIRTILHLLPQFQSDASIGLRVFITSKPELPVRLGFKKISKGSY